MSNLQPLIYAEIIRIAYGQSKTVIAAGLIAGPLFLWSIWEVADHAKLLIWLACLSLLLIVRIIPYVMFLRRQPNEEEMQPWGRVITIFSLLHGLLWGSPALFAIPAADPVYDVIIAMWMLGISAAAVGMYSAHISAMLTFFIPVVLPGTIHLFIIGDQLHTTLGLIVSFYIIIILRAMLPINRSMTNAIRLNFELEEEIRERKKIEEKLLKMSTDGRTHGAFQPASFR